MTETSEILVKSCSFFSPYTTDNTSTVVIFFSQLLQFRNTRCLRFRVSCQSGRLKPRHNNGAGVVNQILHFPSQNTNTQILQAHETGAELILVSKCCLLQSFVFILCTFWRQHNWHDHLLKKKLAPLSAGFLSPSLCLQSRM